jgi:hypothetical protein
MNIQTEVSKDQHTILSKITIFLREFEKGFSVSLDDDIFIEINGAGQERINRFSTTEKDFPLNKVSVYTCNSPVGKV